MIRLILVIFILITDMLIYSLHIKWTAIILVYLHWDHRATRLQCAWLAALVPDTVYPEKYAHGFVVPCFVVVMQSFIMNSYDVFMHIHHGCFAGTGAIVRLPQCQWSKPDGYGKISQCLTTTKHSKAKTACIFLGIYCTYRAYVVEWHFVGFVGNAIRCD